MTSQEDQTREVDDVSLLKRANQLGCALFTQDQDFLRMASIDLAGTGNHAGILYANQNACSIGTLINELQLVTEVLTPEEIVGRVIYLPLR